MKKTIVLSIALSIAAVCLSACNTINGIGKDVQVVGEKVESASKK